MKESHTGYALVALSANDWRNQWVGRQQILSRLGRRHPIVYSTGTWFVWDRQSPEWAAAPWRGRFTQENNVWVDDPPRWMMRWPKMPPLDHAMIRLEARRWRRKLSGRGPDLLIAYVCHPAYYPYLAALGADRIVYHPYDSFDHLPSWTTELEQFERRLFERAQLMMSPSEMLSQDFERRASRPVRTLLNGANTEAFRQAAMSSAPEPEDLAAIPHPRIGYTGSVHPQLDYSLVRRIAQARPDYHWVFVGPRQHEQGLAADSDFVACTRLANVHFLGSRAPDMVPLYTARMDVNVMVYRMTEASWTKFAYPLKLHEYLASGRPFVGVELRMLKPFADVIRFAQGPDDWIAALDDAIHRGGTGTPNARQAAAAGHSWDARVDLLEGWLEEVAAGRLDESRDAKRP